MEFLAAPVRGNGKVIKAGGLTIAVSGPEDTYLKVAHLLDHIALSETKEELAQCQQEFAAARQINRELIARINRER